MLSGILIAGWSVLDGRLDIDLPHRLLQLGVIRGQILQQLDLAIKVDHEGPVHRPGDHLVEETPAGRALAVDIVALAHAGVDQQADG